MVHLFHVESKAFNPDAYLNTFHPAADAEFYTQAQDVLREKALSNQKMRRILTISSSPLILDNYIKVNSVAKQVHSSNLESQINHIGNEQQGSCL